MLYSFATVSDLIVEHTASYNTKKYKPGLSGIRRGWVYLPYRLTTRVHEHHLYSREINHGIKEGAYCYLDL